MKKRTEHIAETEMSNFFVDSELSIGAQEETPEVENTSEKSKTIATQT